MSGITAACKCGQFQQPRLRACASSQHATHAALAAHITAPQPLKHQLVSPLSHFHCACQLHVCSNSCPLCRVAEAPPACCWCPQSRLQHQAGRCPTSLSTRSSSCPRLGCIEFHWGPSAKAQVRSTVRPSCSDSLRSTMRNDYLQTPHHIQRALPEPFACSAGELVLNTILIASGAVCMLQAEAWAVPGIRRPAAIAWQEWLYRQADRWGEAHAKTTSTSCVRSFRLGSAAYVGM